MDPNGPPWTQKKFKKSNHMFSLDGVGEWSGPILDLPQTQGSGPRGGGGGWVGLGEDGTLRT